MNIHSLAERADWYSWPPRRFWRWLLLHLDQHSLYQELLYAVEKKYDGESRHQTALRFIHMAQYRDSNSKVQSHS